MMKTVLLVAVGLLTVPSVWADGSEVVVDYATDCPLEPIDHQCLLDQALQIHCQSQGLDPCVAKLNLECVEPGGVGGPIALGYRTPVQKNGAFVEVADSVDRSNPTKMQFQRLRYIIDTGGCN